MNYQRTSRKIKISNKVKISFNFGGDIYSFEKSKISEPEPSEALPEHKSKRRILRDTKKECSQIHI
jgi:hypothetical protein